MRSSAPGATVRGSVVGTGARVGAGTVLDGVVVGDGADVGAGNELRRRRPGVVRRHHPRVLDPLLPGRALHLTGPRLGCRCPGRGGTAWRA